MISNPFKLYLTVKKLYHINEAQTFKWSEVKITLGRKRHLAAVIGNENLQYINELKELNYYQRQLNQNRNLHSLLLQVNLRESYVLLIIFYCTITPLVDFMQPIEDVIWFNLIPAITGGHLCSENDRILLALARRFGGLLTQFLMNIPISKLKKYNNIIKNIN